MLSRDDLLLGKIVVDAEFVTPAQVEEAIQLQRSAGDGRPIGQILVERGYLTQTELNDLLDIQREYLQQQSDALEATGGRPGSAPILEAIGPSAPGEAADEFPIPQIPGYRIHRILGRGSMGIVYKAVQMSMDRPVAIKVLAPRFAKNQSFVKRFLIEARASARLNHPNIVQGLDVGECDGLYYFIMEYLDGRRVGDLLKRGGAMDERRATNVVVQIARALEHAHQLGIIHRDIKPDNIMLTHDGTAKLCDLGLVRWVKGDSVHCPSEGRVGTPHYMAPEQIRGEPIDTRSDIYALGASFYHMVAGQVPFDGATVEEVLTKHLQETLTPPGNRNPEISQKVEYVITRMMAKSPADRYQNPQALLKDLVLAQVGAKPLGMAEAGRPEVRVPARPTPRLDRLVGRAAKKRPTQRKTRTQEP